MTSGGCVLVNSALSSAGSKPRMEDRDNPTGGESFGDQRREPSRARVRRPAGIELVDRTEDR
jgi:hypothetical protein